MSWQTTRKLNAPGDNSDNDNDYGKDKNDDNDFNDEDDDNNRLTIFGCHGNSI